MPGYLTKSLVFSALFLSSSFASDYNLEEPHPLKQVPWPPYVDYLEERLRKVHWKLFSISPDDMRECRTNPSVFYIMNGIGRIIRKNKFIRGESLIDDFLERENAERSARIYDLVMEERALLQLRSEASSERYKIPKLPPGPQFKRSPHQ